MASVGDQGLGNFIRRLRHARGLTQESLARRGHFSADTVRRLEAGAFSPSLQTLRKLVRGLDLTLSTFFTALELGGDGPDIELDDLLTTRTPAERRRAFRLLVVFFDALDETTADGRAAEPADDHVPEQLSTDDDEPGGESE